MVVTELLAEAVADGLRMRNPVSLDLASGTPLLGRSSGRGLGLEVVIPPQCNKLLRSLSIRNR